MARLHRRDLLKAIAAAAPLTFGGRVWAAPKADARLLVVFLRGAYDAANIVIPTGSDFYYRSRPNLAVARPADDNPASAIALDADWGLHPVLRSSLHGFWQNRQLAFIPFAGSGDLTRSHFETQDSIELGQEIEGTRDYRSGFMGRLAHVLAGGRPIAFTDQLPLIFRGPAAIPNTAIAAVGKPAIDARQARLIAAMYHGTKLQEAVAEGFDVREKVFLSLSEEMAAASRGAVSPKGFELSARRIGRLMREQYNLGFVDVGGWDTHVNQGNATGYLADRIGELGRGLAGFAEEIGPGAWADTVVVVISEFGRTFRENGDRGTDHGHGSVYWAMGGGISGGRMAGDQVAVSQATLFQNRDFPVLTDYRAMFGGLLQSLYGLTEDQLQQVFPGAKPKNIGLV